MAGRKLNIVLQENLHISTAAELKAQLLACLVKQQAVCLKAAAVQRIDTASVQVLLAFVRALQEQGLALSWDHPSHELVQSTQILGAASALGLAEQ